MEMEFSGSQYAIRQSTNGLNFIRKATNKERFFFCFCQTPAKGKAPSEKLRNWSFGRQPTNEGNCLSAVNVCERLLSIGLTYSDPRIKNSAVTLLCTVNGLSHIPNKTSKSKYWLHFIYSGFLAINNEARLSVFGLISSSLYSQQWLNLNL